MKRYLARIKGRYYIVGNIDNKLYRISIPETVETKVIYDYFVMNDEEFKTLCKYDRKFSRDK